MNIECPVCLNEINKDQICLTDCKHEFCYNCLYKWLRININCPICREDVETFKYNNETNRLFVVNHIEEIDNLSQVEKDDYFRTLQQIDKGAEIKAESWNEYVSELYKDINFINTMDESIALAKDEFE